MRCPTSLLPVMALFGSSTATASPVVNNQSQKIKTELELQIAQELAVANATELVNKITENCFTKCIDYPQDSITAPQNLCVNQCLERYMRSWNVISKHYVARIQKEKAN